MMWNEANDGWQSKIDAIVKEIKVRNCFDKKPPLRILKVNKWERIHFYFFDRLNPNDWNSIKLHIKSRSIFHVDSVDLPTKWNATKILRKKCSSDISKNEKGNGQSVKKNIVNLMAAVKWMSCGFLNYTCDWIMENDGSRK